MKVFLLGLFSFSAWNIQGNVLVKRYQILDDRYQTYTRYLHPVTADNHFLTLSLSMSDILDLIDESKKLSEEKTSDDKKLQNALGFIDKYINSEFFAKAFTEIGISLFSFNISRIQFEPNIRFMFSGGGLVTMVKKDTPNLPPDIDTSDDHVINYINLETKVGLFTDYKVGERKRWGGAINLYKLSRTDSHRQADAKKLSKDKKSITKRRSSKEENNNTTFLNLDYTTTYTRKNLQISMGIEEIPVVKLSDNKEKAGKIIYNATPVLRYDIKYKHRIGAFQILPFIGVHKRKDYEIKDGYYGGGIGSFIFFKDRLQMNLAWQLDAEYTTFSNRVKFWPLEISVTHKKPRKKYVNNIKLSEMSGVQVSLVF